MNLKKLMTVPMLAMALFAVGCGPDCEGNCEDSAKCDGSPLADVDCGDYCSKVEDLNDKAGCGDQFDDLLSCASDQDDICKGDACSSESKAYSDCFGKYCEKHLEECAKLFE
ncbi:MAG TPA: hypothetical protein VF103_08555 [Polyangiaceae bacterium]